MARLRVVKSWIVNPLNIIGLIGVASLLPIFAYVAIRGWYVRYVADDFCTARSVIEHGWWGAQAYWYQSWSGRFSFTAIITGLEKLGEGVAQVTPITMLMIWWVGMSWVIHEGFTFAKIKIGSVASTFLAGAAICMYALTNTHPGQVLYWFTGSITYTLPLVLVTFAIGVVLRLFRTFISIDRDFVLTTELYKSRWSILAAVGLLIVSASLNETHAVYQVLALIAAGLAIALWKGLSLRLRVLELVVVAILLSGTLLSTLIMYVAPGNDIRSSNYPPNPPLNEAIEFSFNATNSFLIIDWQYAWFFYLAGFSLLLAFLAMGRDSNPKFTHKTLVKIFHDSVLVVIGAYLLSVSVQFPSYYVQHYPTYERSLSPIVFTLAMAAIILGVQLARVVAPFAKRLSRQWYLSLVLGFGLLCIGLVFTSQSVYVISELRSDLDSLRQYTHAWDEQSQRLHSREGSRQVEYVGRLGHTFELEDVSANPKHWINRCMADYYGVGSIEAR